MTDLKKLADNHAYLNAILQKRHDFERAKTTWGNDQYWLFYKDVGSLFDVLIPLSFATEFSQLPVNLQNALTHVASIAKSQWQWSYASEQLFHHTSPNKMRLYLVIQLFSKSDAMLYRLSSDAIMFKSFNELRSSLR